MRQCSAKSLFLVAGASLLIMPAVLPQLALSQDTPRQGTGLRLPSSLQTPVSSPRSRAFRLITIQGRVVSIQGQTVSVRTTGATFDVDISKARYETASAEPTVHQLRLNEDVVITGLTPHSSDTLVRPSQIRSFKASIIQVRVPDSDRYSDR